MAASRSAFRYLLRNGLVSETNSPAPRLNTADLLVARLPRDETQLTQGELETYEGDPAPDRGSVRPWPNA